MYRTSGAILSAVALFGCAQAPVTPSRSLPAPRDACSATSAVTAQFVTPLSMADPEWGRRIDRVELRGHEEIPAALIRTAITTREGDPLDALRIRDDLERLLALEVLDNVSVESELIRDKLVVRYVLEPRRRIGSVVLRGFDTPSWARWRPIARGELYDAERAQRAGADLETHLVDSGHLLAKVETRARAGGELVDVCFVVDAGPALVLERIDFAENQQISDADLVQQIATHDGRVNRAGKVYRADLFEQDLLRVRALYYDRGFLSVQVGEPSVRLDARRGLVSVSVPISEGPVFRLRRIRFTGGERRLYPRYAELLGANAGNVFGRAELLDGMERIRELYRARGENVDVEPQTTLDEAARTVDLVITVEREP